MPRPTLGSQPQLERGGLDSALVAGVASEDRLAHLLICWRQTPGSPETACWQRWMTGMAGEREQWCWERRGGGGGVRGGG